ncbi:MAG: hypothetical protein NZ108_11115, partial [Bacteroidia bacterium]|nr:hypothetical protein [Bacteroidia bacterium]
MMKRWIYLLSLISSLAVQISIAQTWICGFEDTDLAVNQEDGYGYQFNTPNCQLPDFEIPCPTGIMYIKVNIHFIQKPDGSGNFTETGDGHFPPLNNIPYSNQPITGRWYAQDLVEQMNSILKNNPPMHLYCGENPPPNLPTRIRFVLNKTLFHQDERYGKSGILFQDLDQDQGQAVNIYFHEVKSAETAYTSSLNNPRLFAVITKAWTQYSNPAPNPKDFYLPWFYAPTMLHEIFHAMGLSHTHRYNHAIFGGNCAEVWNDCCDDTPDVKDLENCTGVKQGVWGCPCWGTEGYNKCPEINGKKVTPNNIMDYSS